MTGAAWGRAPAPGGDGTIVVDVRSVNGKGLSVKQRLAADVSGCERAIEERVKARIHRGTVVVQVAVERGSAAVGQAIDAGRFAAAAALLAELAAAAGLEPPRVRDVLLVPGVVVAPVAAPSDAEERPGDDVPPELTRLLDEVLDRLVAAREAEGATTAAAMREHLGVLARGLSVVAARAPLVVAEHRERLIERVNEFLAGRALRLEPQDVVRELGVYADRVDVSEEIQRLGAHLDRAGAMLDAGGQVGRPLEFLLQEMLRETNTIGSKSPDVEIAHTVVAMKSAVDRLKEQAANLE